jgi:hypothetical protein
MTTPFEILITSSYKADLIRHMREHPEAFEEAVALAVTRKPPYSWRAAWLLWSCMEHDDARVRPHLMKLVRTLAVTTDNHQRELFKILQEMELDERHESALFDLCMNAWENPATQPSVRVNALKLLVRIARRYPDLFRELELLTRQQYLDTLSPGVRASVTRIMKEEKGKRKTANRADRARRAMRSEEGRVG